MLEACRCRREEVQVQMSSIMRSVGGSSGGGTRSRKRCERCMCTALRKMRATPAEFSG